jgi:hypothetical protein
MLVVAHFALLLLLPLVVAVAVATGLWLAMVRSARRQAERSRRGITAAGGETANATVVRGRLLVLGDGLDAVTVGDGLDLAPRGRAKLAAETVWLSKRLLSTPARGETTRAEQLGIDTGKGVVLLGPAAFVEAGSELRVTGRRTATAAGMRRVAEAILHDGDEVIAAGRLDKRPAPTGTGDYRGAATEPLLEPLAPEAAIRIAACAPPTIRVARRVLYRHLAVVLSALVCCAPGCGAVNSYLKKSCAACANDGRCQTVPLWRHAPLGEALREMLDGQHFSCAPKSNADCLASTSCAKDGNCSAVGEACRAASREDCTHTLSCLEYGFCTPVDGRCLAAGEQDCWHTDSCLLYGSCVATGHVCEAKSDEGCRLTEECRERGLCSADGKGCVAKRDEDCASSWYCLSDMRCAAKEGACVVRPESCRESLECYERGRCTPGILGCEASVEDCQVSEGCAEGRQCRHDENAALGCDDDAPICRDSAACYIHGRCSVGYPCVPGSDQDCARSRACKEGGACKAIDGACATSCRDHPACKTNGRCTLQGKRCVAATDADCAESLRCKERGDCAARDGRCEATSEGCARTPSCRLHGRCSVRSSGGCELASDADCAKTRGCEAEGRCRLVDGNCTIARDEDCRKTALCALLGRCRAPEKSVSYYEAECVVAKDEDCRGSEICKRFGWCAALPNPSLYVRKSTKTVCFEKPPGPVQPHPG